MQLPLPLDVARAVCYLVISSSLGELRTVLTFDKVEAVDLARGEKQILQSQSLSLLRLSDLSADSSQVLHKRLCCLRDNKQGLFGEHLAIRVQVDD